MGGEHRTFSVGHRGMQYLSSGDGRLVLRLVRHGFQLTARGSGGISL